VYTRWCLYSPRPVLIFLERYIHSGIREKIEIYKFLLFYLKGGRALLPVPLSFLYGYPFPFSLFFLVCVCLIRYKKKWGIIIKKLSFCVWRPLKSQMTATKKEDDGQRKSHDH
jgi:hypothetical protein